MVSVNSDSTCCCPGERERRQSPPCCDQLVVPLTSQWRCARNTLLTSQYSLTSSQTNPNTNSILTIDFQNYEGLVLTLTLHNAALDNVHIWRGQSASNDGRGQNCSGRSSIIFTLGNFYFFHLKMVQLSNKEEIYFIEPVIKIGGVVLSEEIARDYMFNIVNLIFNYLGVMVTYLLVQVIF